jgi:glutathione S-transferase
MEEKDFDEDHKGVTLYMGHFCPFSQRCEIALREKGVEFKKIYVRTGRSAPKWFLRLAPNGKVPVLLHDEHVVCDSQPILLYLENVFPKPNLLPEDDDEKKQMLVRITESGKFMLSFAKFLFCKNPRELSRYKADLTIHLDAHERAIAGTFFAGDNLTLLDIVLWTVYHRFSALKHYKRFELSKLTYGRLHSWLATLESREAFKMAKFGDDGAGETGPFIKSLERKARPGPLDMVTMLNNTLVRSLEQLQDRLHMLGATARGEEIHDIELDSVNKEFEQLFGVIAVQRKCKGEVLYPYLESLRKNEGVVGGAAGAALAGASDVILPKDPYEPIEEALNSLKAQLTIFREAKMPDRRSSAQNLSSTVGKVALVLDDLIDEEEKVLNDHALNSQSWEDQARTLQLIFQSLSESQIHLLVVWSFKHSTDKAARLQLLRPLAFSFPGAQYQQFIEWLESEASAEYASVAGQAKRLIRTSNASDGRGDRSLSASGSLIPSNSSGAIGGGLGGIIPVLPASLAPPAMSAMSAASSPSSPSSPSSASGRGGLGPSSHSPSKDAAPLAKSGAVAAS